MPGELALLLTARMALSRLGEFGWRIASYFPRRMEMPIINIVIALIIVGMALWLINRYIPMASSIKMILNVVVVVSIGIWVLQATGLWGPISSYRLSR
jgi:hypothetical protein